MRRSNAYLQRAGKPDKTASNITMVFALVMFVMGLMLLFSWYAGVGLIAMGVGFAMMLLAIFLRV
jgi:hypothetical protein